VADEEAKVYALNLLDIADREEYLAYSRRSAREVARHGTQIRPTAEHINGDPDSHGHSLPCSGAHVIRPCHTSAAPAERGQTALSSCPRSEWASGPMRTTRLSSIRSALEAF